MAQAASASAQRAAARRRQKATAARGRRKTGGPSGIRWDRVARAALLGTLGVVLLLYISPLHRWITQRSLAAQETQQLSQLQQQNKQLRSHIALLHNPALGSWDYMIRSALNTVRVARRSASLAPLKPREASQIISNDAPANAGDLSAIVVGHLRDLALKIRNGATNDYKQYWNLESDTPKIENECRDALLFWIENAIQTELLAGDSEHLLVEDHRYEIQTVEID